MITGIFARGEEGQVEIALSLVGEQGMEVNVARPPVQDASGIYIHRRLAALPIEERGNWKAFWGRVEEALQPSY